MELVVVVVFFVCATIWGRMGAMSTTAVQKLYDVCKATFSASSGIPSAAALERVRSALENVKALDVGLEEEEQSERGFGFFGSSGETGRHSSMVPRWSPPISYLHLYECEQFSMGIFCLPTSAAIPLHNHPGMTVLSRLLYGSVHVRAYDWVNPFDEKLNADPSRPRLAKLVVDHVLTAPCETAVLYPTTGGNIHAFTALTPCALLDVLAPPYSPATGRHCTYYHNVPRARFAGSDGSDGLQENGDIAAENPNYEWLEGFQPPEDFVVQRGIYRGPKVVPSMSGSNMVTTPAAWNKSLRRRSTMLASHMRTRYELKLSKAVLGSEDNAAFLHAGKTNLVTTNFSVNGST